MNEESLSRQSSFDERKHLNNELQKLSNRELTWLRIRLVSLMSYDISKLTKLTKLTELPRNTLIERMIDILGYDKRCIEEVDRSISKMGNYLVREEHFDWLIDDLRAQIFSEFTLRLENQTIKIKNIYGHKKLDIIYEFFDFARPNNEIMDLGQKIHLLQDIEVRFKKLQRANNYTEWLNEKDTKQIKWTQKYLDSINLYTEKFDEKFDKKLKTKDIRAISLARLDLLDPPIQQDSLIQYVQSDRKERVIDKMKRAWSQQKYRDAGKTKKPYHLPLTKQTQGRLEKMAQVKGLSQTALLDILINSEYKLKFLDVDGKEIY